MQLAQALPPSLQESSHDVHLIARNEDEVKAISEELGCSYSVADVLRRKLYR